MACFRDLATDALFVLSLSKGFGVSALHSVPLCSVFQTNGKPPCEFTIHPKPFSLCLVRFLDRAGVDCSGCNRKTKVRSLVTGLGFLSFLYFRVFDSISNLGLNPFFVLSLSFEYRTTKFCSSQMSLRSQNSHSVYLSRYLH